jgi:hypothetical protein
MNTLYKPLSKLAIYDLGEGISDRYRYTIVYLDCPERGSNLFACVGFSGHSSAMVGSHLGKQIEWEDLPIGLQRVVLQDLGL